VISLDHHCPCLVHSSTVNLYKVFLFPMDNR
jgi:hypothetical protein